MNEIENVLVTYPSAVGQAGVVIIDTPGTNDLDVMREEITYRYLPQADAAIFLFNARIPGSESEFNFLNNRVMDADIQRIFFVINMVDVLDNEEKRNKVVSHVRDNLQKRVPDPKVYPLSAKAALKGKQGAVWNPMVGAPMTYENSGFPDFERDLARFLENERGQIKLTGPATRGARVCGELERQIRVSTQSLKVPVEQLEKAVSATRKELTTAVNASREVLNRLNSSLIASGNTLKSHLKMGLEDVANAAMAAVKSYTGPIDKTEIARVVENCIAPIQTRLYEEIRSQQEGIIREELLRAHRQLRFHWESVEEVLHTSLGVTVKPQDIEEVVIGDLDVVVKSGVGAGGILLLLGALNLWIIGVFAALAGGGFLYHFFEGAKRSQALSQISAQVDKRFRDPIPIVLNDFMSKWQVACNDTIGNLQGELSMKQRELERELDDLISQRNMAQQSAAETQARFDSMTQRLHRAYTELTTV